MSYYDAVGMGGSPSLEEKRLPPAYSGNAEIARAYAMRRARSGQGQTPTHSFAQSQGSSQMPGVGAMMGAWNQNPIPMGAIGDAFMNHGAALSGAMGQIGDTLNRNADRQVMAGQLQSVDSGKTQRLGMIGQIMSNMLGGGRGMGGGGGAPFFTNFGQFALPGGMAGMGGGGGGGGFLDNQGLADYARNADAQRDNLFKLVGGLRGINQNGEVPAWATASGRF